MGEQRPEIYALRKLSKRQATEEELETTRAFFQKGNGERALVGVLFIHGFTVTPANFRAYAQRFAAEGFTVSVPLLPGHGGRPADLQKISWTAWLDRVLEAYDELAAECSEVHVVGISLGGALALNLARRRADVAKLFLLAPAVFPIPLLSVAVRTIVPVFSRVGIRYWMHVAGDVKDPEGFELGYGKTAVNGLKELHACMLETQRVLPWVKTDTLIFQGKVDHEVPADMARVIYSQLGSKEKQLIWLENSFHEIPRDGDSEFVAQRILEDLSLARV